jgi:hypothetical protein
MDGLAREWGIAVGFSPGVSGIMDIGKKDIFGSLRTNLWTVPPPQKPTHP